MVDYAQSATEHIVIIAVVVVISLAVVGLIINSTGPVQNSSASISKLNAKVGVGSISIVDVVAGGDRNGLLVIKNISPEYVTVTAISVDGADHNYSKLLAFGGGSRVLS